MEAGSLIQAGPRLDATWPVCQMTTFYRQLCTPKFLIDSTQLMLSSPRRMFSMFLLQHLPNTIQCDLMLLTLTLSLSHTLAQVTNVKHGLQTME